MGTLLLAFFLLIAAGTCVYSQGQKLAPAGSASQGDSLGQLVSLLREKAKALEASTGMRLGFQSFTSAHKLAPGSIHYSDYVIVRLLFEATRDAGFWHLLWNQRLRRSAMNFRRYTRSLLSTLASRVLGSFGQRRIIRLRSGSYAQRLARLCA